MISKNRNEFRYLPPISDNEIYGIGLVSVSWATLEHMMDICLSAAFGGPYENEKGSRNTFIERARALKAKASEELSDPWKAEICSFVDAALSLKGQRDLVIHGVWGEDTQGKVGVTQAKMIRPNNRRMDFGQLKSLSLSIEEALVRLTGTVHSARAAAGKEEITLSDAWLLMKAKARV